MHEIAKLVAIIANTIEIGHRPAEFVLASRTKPISPSNASPNVEVTAYHSCPAATTASVL